MIDRRELPKTVNGNLLKKYYSRSHYKPVIIIETTINKNEESIELVKVNMLTEKIRKRIVRNIKKGSERSKKNYYHLRKRIIKKNEKIDLYSK